jgi:uncharacterized membrane protein YkoI
LITVTFVAGAMAIGDRDADDYRRAVDGAKITFADAITIAQGQGQVADGKIVAVELTWAGNAPRYGIEFLVKKRYKTVYVDGATRKVLRVSVGNRTSDRRDAKVDGKALEVTKLDFPAVAKAVESVRPMASMVEADLQSDAAGTYYAVKFLQSMSVASVRVNAETGKVTLD